MVCIWICWNVFWVAYPDSKFTEKIMSKIITSLKTIITHIANSIWVHQKWKLFQHLYWGQIYFVWLFSISIIATIMKMDNTQNFHFNPLTILTVYHTNLMTLVWKLCIGSTNNPLNDIFFYPHHLSAWFCTCSPWEMKGWNKRGEIMTSS